MSLRYCIPGQMSFSFLTISYGRRCAAAAAFDDDEKFLHIIMPLRMTLLHEYSSIITAFFSLRRKPTAIFLKSLVSLIDTFEGLYIYIFTYLFAPVSLLK